MVYWGKNPTAVVKEGTREEEFEISNAHNIIRNFAERGNEGAVVEVRFKEGLLKMREITACLYVYGNYPIERKNIPGAKFLNKQRGISR